MSPKHHQKASESHLDNPTSPTHSESLLFQFHSPLEDHSHIMDSGNPALADHAARPVPSPNIVPPINAPSDSDIDSDPDTEPDKKLIPASCGSLEDAFTPVRTVRKPPRIVNSSSDVDMGSGGSALPSLPDRPAHEPASDWTPAQSSSEGRPDSGPDIPPSPSRTVCNSASTAQPSSKTALTATSSSHASPSPSSENPKKSKKNSNKNPSKNISPPVSTWLRKATKDLVANGEAYTEFQKSCYVKWAKPGSSPIVYDDWVKTFYPMERCPVPTKLPDTAMEKRNFRVRLMKSDNPPIADIHAFYPWVGIYQEGRNLPPLFWKRALQMNASSKLDASGLYAITERILKDQLRVEAVISSFFRSLTPRAQRRAVEWFKTMRPRDAAKTIMIRQGGTLVGLQLKPNATGDLTFEEAQAARPIIQGKLRGIGEDAALECEVTLADWTHWWEDAESNIRDGIPVEMDSKLAVDLDRALNAYILSIYCKKASVHVDMHFESIRINARQTVHQGTIKRKYPMLEYAPMWKEYFGNGDSFFMPEPLKHPKVFEPITEFQVQFPDYVIEEWPELASHSGKRYKPIPIMVNWIPFMITTNFHWDPEEAEGIYNRMWAPGAVIPQCFIVNMYEAEFKYENTGEYVGEFIIHGLMAPSNTDAPIPIHPNTGGDYIGFTAFEHIRHCTHCYKMDHFRHDCPQSYCNRCRVEGHWTKDCPKERARKRHHGQAGPNHSEEQRHVAEPRPDSHFQSNGLKMNRKDGQNGQN